MIESFEDLDLEAIKNVRPFYRHPSYGPYTAAYELYEIYPIRPDQIWNSVRFLVRGFIDIALTITMGELPD